MATYIVYLKDGSSYETPSENVANVQRLLAGSIDFIQPKEAAEADLVAVESEPLIKASDYTLKELKAMADKMDVDYPTNVKKAALVELLNTKLS